MSPYRDPEKAKDYWRKKKQAQRSVQPLSNPAKLSNPPDGESCLSNPVQPDIASAAPKNLAQLRGKPLQDGVASEDQTDVLPPAWAHVKDYISTPCPGMPRLERLQRIAGALGKKAGEVWFGELTMEEIGEVIGTIKPSPQPVEAPAVLSRGSSTFKVSIDDILRRAAQAGKT